MIILRRVNVGVDIGLGTSTVVFVVSVRVGKHIGVVREDGRVASAGVGSEPGDIPRGTSRVRREVAIDMVLAKNDLKM